MTLKELKTIINTYPEIDDSARVYMEIQLGENTYIQQSVDSVRREEGNVAIYYIMGSNGGESN